MHRLIRAGALALALAGLAATAVAQSADAAAPQPPAATPPAAAAPEPRPDDTNAQRQKSQPGNNAPAWRAVRDQGGTSSLPGAEKGVLIQPFVKYPGSRWTNAGEAWRQVRNEWLIPYGGWLLVAVLLALALFYWRKGVIGQARNDGTGPIERFTPFERAAHWTNAIAFVLLAVSGLVMAFGKTVLLPLIGSTLFGWLTYALKTLHNFVGPLFAVTLVIVILTFIRDNLPQSGDGRWLARLGGLLDEHEIPSHRFNAGEKVVFWAGVLVLGLTAVGSGLVMDHLVPGLDYVRSDMHIAHMVHNTAAVLMVALFLGHIYIGTIGMHGAYSAMRNGYVNEAWAHEHHELWHEEIKAGRIPARRSADTPPPQRAVPPARA